MVLVVLVLASSTRVCRGPQLSVGIVVCSKGHRANSLSAQATGHSTPGKSEGKTAAETQIVSTITLYNVYNLPMCAFLMILGPFHARPSGLVRRACLASCSCSSNACLIILLFLAKEHAQMEKAKILNPRGSIFFWQTAAHGQGNQWTWKWQLVSPLKCCNERQLLGSLPHIQPI